MEKCCVIAQKWYGFPYKAGTTKLKPLKNSLLLLRKSIFRDHSLQQQVHFAATNRYKLSLVKFIPETCRWSEVGAQTLSSLKKLSHIKDAIFKNN